jgi:hypothetical protein
MVDNCGNRQTGKECGSEEICNECGDDDGETWLHKLYTSAGSCGSKSGEKCGQ